MSSDKKRLGRGISSLLGSDFDFDDHVEEIISKTAAEKPAETKPEKKKVSNGFVYKITKSQRTIFGVVA